MEGGFGSDKRKFFAGEGGEALHFQRAVAATSLQCWSSESRGSGAALVEGSLLWQDLQRSIPGCCESVVCAGARLAVLCAPGAAAAALGLTKLQSALVSSLQFGEDMNEHLHTSVEHNDASMDLVKQRIYYFYL